jgi:hypothetical protein
VNSTYTDELRHAVQQSRWHRVLLAACTAVQGVAVYFGLSTLMVESGWGGVAIPIVTALAVAVVLYIFWDFACTTFPLLHSPARRAMACGFAVVMGLASVGISSWFIAAAIGGDQAIIRHQQDYTKEATKQFDIALAKREDALGSKASEIAAGWRALAQNEGKNGSETGKPGFGKHAQTLMDAAASFDSYAALVNSKRTEADGLHKQATALIAEMGKSIEQPKFIEMAAKLKQFLVKLDNTSATAQAGMVGLINARSTNEESVRITATEQTKELRKLASDVDAAREKVGLDAYVPLSPAIAVIRYASAAPGGWVVGVCLDLVPMILLLIMMLLHAEAREPYERREPFGRSAELRTIRPAE